MLAGRRIVLGVSGGVAAYKAAYLARRLVERGATVRTIMTASAAEFIGPQTLAAITGAEPLRELFGSADPSPHTNLARWADAIVIAPATAATLARIANGLSEDALSATALASWGKPLVIAPAMHTEMWDHPATQRNIATLESDGHILIGPESGALAGGDEGVGRMAEPDVIVDGIVRLLSPGDLRGWRVLVNAGGTREPIDPVRYIGNRSSGKMGSAIAVAAAERGADVTLVTSAPAPVASGIEVVEVETAQEMADAVWSRASDADVAVLAAAVADFRPSNPAETKLRRAKGAPGIDLEPTPDILAGVAAMEDRPFLVGFAAETGSLEEAVEKAKRKGVDLLVGNDVSKQGSGFGTDTNEVTLVTPDGISEPWSLMSKREVADRLWDRIRQLRPEDAS
jgi:phosphopantothenoylcysteine decarboxylase/phosphopantothenate--cysteine ligase